MACRLILNADDFGLTRGVNRAIAELHRAGAVTSTTLMATAPAFEDAVALAKSLPTLGVGCHVVLVDGKPASPREKILSLLATSRKTFRPTFASFARDLLLGCIREEDIAHEAEAQIRKLQTASIHVTHVDTHKHTHIFPPVARAVLLAARRCGIPAIRNPFEPPWSTALSRPDASPVRLLQLSILQKFKPSFTRHFQPESTEQTTRGTLGIAATGSLDAHTLRTLLQAIPEQADEAAVYELVCHPGYNDEDLAQANTRLLHQRDVERRALLEVIPPWRTSPNSPTLIHYGNLND